MSSSIGHSVPTPQLMPVTSCNDVSVREVQVQARSSRLNCLRAADQLGTCFDLNSACRRLFLAGLLALAGFGRLPGRLFGRLLLNGRGLHKRNKLAVFWIGRGSKRLAQERYRDTQRAVSQSCQPPLTPGHKRAKSLGHNNAALGLKVAHLYTI